MKRILFGSIIRIKRSETSAHVFTIMASSIHEWVLMDDENIMKIDVDKMSQNPHIFLLKKNKKPLQSHKYKTVMYYYSYFVPN